MKTKSSSQSAFFNLRILIAALLLLIGSAFSTPSAFAQCTQTTTWRAATGSWFVATNWDNGVPNSTKAAQINNGGTAQITSSLATTSACSLTLGNGENDTGSVSINGAGRALNVGGHVIVGNAGTGTVSAVNGGAVTSGDLSLAVSDRLFAISHGTVTIGGSGSTWTVNGKVDVATHGSIGLLTIDSGGTMNINGNGSTTNNLVLGVNATTGFGVTSSTAGKISVQGTATVNGALVVTFSGIGFTPGTRYTLLTATGGRTGMFTNVSYINTPSNVCPVIQYDGNNVYLFLQLMCP